MNRLSDCRLPGGLLAGLAMVWVVLSTPARAAGLQIMDLQLMPSADWQRATETQEQQDDAYTLVLEAQPSVQVLMPRLPQPVGADAETFYRNLARKWSSVYGADTVVDWLEVERPGKRPIRWLTARRPAQAGEGVVFHLVTLHRGQAYSVLALVPARHDVLPPPVVSLLARIDLAGAASEPAPLAPAGPSWRKTRTVRLYPQGEKLDTLARVETQVMAQEGMLTGYGIEPGAASINWFFDGFKWQRHDQQLKRAPFSVNGQIKLAAPPELDGAPLVLRVSQPQGLLPQRVQVIEYDHCVASDAWHAALWSLRRGSRSELDSLMHAHGCAQHPGVKVLDEIEVAPGADLQRALSMSPPETALRTRLVEVRLKPGRISKAGDAILEHVGMLILYELRP